MHLLLNLRLWLVILLIAAASFLFIKYKNINVLSITSERVTYYIDCNLGNDTNNGTSEGTAWKTISKINDVTLNPGDILLFKRGCTWTNSVSGNYLTLDWQGTADLPITIDAYGTGNLPIIQADARGTSRSQININVTGSYLNINNLRSTLINPYREITCKQADGTGVPLGWYVGYSISGSNNTLSHIEADSLSVGVNLSDVSKNNKILYADIHNLNALWRVDKVLNALGGLGVNLHGDDNEVGYSLFEKNGAQCNFVDNNQDQNYSAPFEIYNSNRSYVHHNRAFNHRKHAEFGKASTKTSTGNVLAYNLFVSAVPKAKGPNIHGSSNPFGPINNTQIYNNTFIFTGPESEALICSCDGGAVVKNNVFVAEWKAAYYTGSFTETNNLYWDYQKTVDTSSDPLVQMLNGTSQTAMSTSSFRVNPLFVNALIPEGDYRLSSSSPGINKGVLITTTDQRLAAIMQRDLGSNLVPMGSALDIGAYEYGSIPSPTPTVTPTPAPSPTSIPVPTLSPTPVPNEDTSPPVVTISSPENGSTIFRLNLVTIAALVVDESSISRVETYINNKIVNTDTTSPYTYLWKVVGKPNAIYNIRVVATDSNGNVGESTSSVISW